MVTGEIAQPSLERAPAAAPSAQQHRHGRLRVAWPSGAALWAALGIWLATRDAFFLFGVGVDLELPHHGVLGRGADWPARLYYWWDSVHFYSIATAGYDFHHSGTHLDSRSPAFFPAYPIAARWLAMPFGGRHPSGASVYWSLAILASVGALVAAIALWHLAADRLGSTVATRSVILLLAGPYAVFLFASYSEGLFLAFAVPAWLAGTRQRWWLAGGLGALAGLTRINGVFLGLALVVMYVTSTRTDGRSKWRTSVIALGLPFVGTFGYFAWLQRRTGSWAEWFTAEKEWHRKLTRPWRSLSQSVHYAVHPPAGAGLQPIAELVFAGAALAVLIAFVVLRRWPEVVYVGASLAALLTSSWYLSVPRSCLLLFPAFILLAELSVRARWRWTWGAMLTVSFTLLAINSLTFVQHQWTG